MKSPCTLRTLSCVFRLWLAPSGWICMSEPLASLFAALLVLLPVRCRLLNILSANRGIICAFLPSLYASPLSSCQYVISSRPYTFSESTQRKRLRFPYESGLVLLHVLFGTILGALSGTLKKLQSFSYNLICLPCLSCPNPIYSGRKIFTGLGWEDVDTIQFSYLNQEADTTHRMKRLFPPTG